MTKTKMLVILGPLGSGKTTLLQALMADENRPSGRTLLVVNDVGQVNVDARRLSSVGELRALTAGCIGCSDLASFLSVMEDAKNNGIENLIVEPTGIADGREIRDAAAQASLLMTVISLVDVEHFERNRALGVMETQLRVADMVGLTWFEEHLGRSVDPSDSRLSDIVEFCGRYAPGKPVHTVPSSGHLLERFLRQVSSAYGKNEEVHASCGCAGCGHHHSHHGHHHHHHDHGVYAESGELPIEFDQVALTAMIASVGYTMVRAKGVVGGYEFDFTQGSLRWGEESSEPSHGTFITTSPLNWLKPTEIGSGKKQLMRGYQVPLEATMSAIQWQLGEYPNNLSPDGVLRVDCEADIIRQLCERSGVPAKDREVVLQLYVSWRLSSLRLLNEGRTEWLNHPDFAYWQRRLGGVLGWHAVHCAEEIGRGLRDQILAEEAPFHALSGLLSLTELSFLEEKAEERPELVADVIRFGMEYKVLSTDLVRRVLSHCLRLAESDADWHQRWQKVHDEFFQ